MPLHYDQGPLYRDNKATALDIPCSACRAPMGIDMANISPGGTKVVCPACKQEHNLSAEGLRELASEIREQQQKKLDVLK